MSKAAERAWRREKAEAAGIQRAILAQPVSKMYEPPGYEPSGHSLLARVYKRAVEGDPAAIWAVEHWEQQPVAIATAAAPGSYSPADYARDLRAAGIRLL